MRWKALAEIYKMHLSTPLHRSRGIRLGEKIYENKRFVEHSILRLGNGIQSCRGFDLRLCLLSETGF